MKTIRMFCNAFVTMALAGLISWSCTKVQADVEQEEVRAVYTAQMVLEGTFTTYDAPTRAASSSWEDDSQVFLQFLVGDKFVEGSAVYDADTDKWGVEYYKPITSGQELRCHAYYFENPVQVGGADIILNERTAVYRDTTATYFFDGDVLTINAHLKPITGRVRFEGGAGAECNFAGCSRYTNYSLTTNTLTASPKEFKDCLPESGKSEYYYVFFDEESPREIRFYDRTNNARFLKKCSPGILAPGKSGYMAAPTVDSHVGWGYNELVRTYTIGEVEFKMILVDKGTFMMGWGPYTTETPIHKVTLTKDYYIAETETTQALWAAVMGESATIGKEECPIINISWDKAVEFTNLLNRIYEGVTFRLPTEAEWEFAAKGGNNSEGYDYSGSSDVERVCWWYNSKFPTSTKQAQPVKTKQPNEIGLFDMSGNASEWCYDWYESYSKNDQIDPVVNLGSSSDEHVLRGGSYNSNPKYFVTCVFREWGSSSGGFRLASY